MNGHDKEARQIEQFAIRVLFYFLYEEVYYEKEEKKKEMLLNRLRISLTSKKAENLGLFFINSRIVSKAVL